MTTWRELQTAEHTTWVESGMVGACPVCGEESGFHDDDGTCEADTDEALCEEERAAAKALVGTHQPLTFYLVVNVVGGDRVRWFGPSEDPADTAIAAATYAEQEGGMVFEVQAAVTVIAVTEQP
ncbi:MAG TPA: hypothetical protein VMR92_08505 [Gemmatimonadales bacterium]|nr:hypothetical protein [Gemmatimonadales bacterium]